MSPDELERAEHWQVSALLPSGAVMMFGVTAKGRAAAVARTQLLLSGTLLAGEAQVSPVLPKRDRDGKVTGE